MPRRSKAKFRVEGRIDNQPSATVTVDEAAGLISVRPLRRRREYTLPLERVCRMIILVVATAEIEEKQRRRRRTTVKRGLLRTGRRTR